MSMRTSERGSWRVIGLVSGAAAALALSALAISCSGGGESAAADAGPGASAPSGSGAAGATVSCALNGALTYANACTLERVTVGGTPTLVIRHPNGGFRRFEVLSGPTLAEADGAQQAVVLRNGNTLEVTLGADRYRLDVSQVGDAS